MLEKLSQTS